MSSGLGYGASAGVVPGVSVSISKHIYQEHLRNLATIQGAQRNRLMMARVEGAFQGHMYLVAPDEETRRAGVALADGVLGVS